ncbi:MAG TPA: hypothetical protein VLZ12_14605 [Verrucomicrobiae bacterium]|nr:hypothetical protein [Verrucomicrobiae bacterium]
MGNIVKKCPKDGVEHDVGFTGNCESCFGPLQFYCKVHKQWLTEEVCPKCAKPISRTPSRAPAAGGDKSDLAIIFGVLVLLVAVIIGIYGGVVHGRRRPKPQNAPPAAQATAQVSQPAPQPVAPPVSPPVSKEPQPATPSFPTYPPIELAIADILVDPDKYLNKLVRTSGQIQLKEPDKESFDLRQGDHSIQVIYRYVGRSMKSQVAGDTANRTVTVTGLLQLDQNYNSYYIVAQELRLP